METKRLLLLLPLLSSTVLFRFSTGTVFTVRADHRYDVSPAAVHTFPSVEPGGGGGRSRCVMKCRVMSDCVGVNVQWSGVTSSLRCELLTMYLHEAPGSLKAAQGWSFIQGGPVYTDGPWFLAFRVTTGIGENVWDTFHANGRHDNSNEMQGCVLPDSGLPCHSHFRSVIMDQWTNIDQVRFRLYKGNSVVAQIIFNGQGSDRLNWMDVAHVLSSTWTDLTTAGANYFSVEGVPSVFRRFYLSHAHAGCSSDLGWLTLADHHSQATVVGQCNWELKVTSLPAIYYSPLSTFCKWGNGDDTADFMMIHVTFVA